MSDQLHDAYRGTVTTTWREDREFTSVSGVGLMITNLDTGEKKATVSRGDGRHERIAPELFEQLYL